MSNDDICLNGDAKDVQPNSRDLTILQEPSQVVYAPSAAYRKLFQSAIERGRSFISLQPERAQSGFTITLTDNINCLTVEIAFSPA